MRHLAILLGLVLLSEASAAPFLTSAPYPDTAPQPTEFLVSLDSGAEVESVAVEGSGGVVLLFDLDGIQFGAHAVSVKAKNAASTSAAAALPFSVGIQTPDLIVIPGVR